jgi:hypothetical protein
VAESRGFKRVDPTQASDPDVLFHYTSTAGLLGIVRSTQMWATDFRYLNDSTELEFGLTAILVALEIMAQGKPRAPSSFVDSLSELYRFDDWPKLGTVQVTEVASKHRERIASAAREMLGGVRSATAFGVTCFCGEGDLLSQWRGYGVSGYAIGFDKQELSQLVVERYLPLSKVIYGKPGSGTLRIMFGGEDARLLDFVVRANRANLQHEVTLPLLRLAGQIKDPTFESEKEWRLGDVARPQDISLRHREGALGVVPYIELPLVTDGELLPIVQVRVAPGPEVALRVAAVESLLRSHGYQTSGTQAVEVLGSAIPFRGR